MINLTQKEKDLFAQLMLVASKFEKPPVVRVAGGWVRDKIIGRPSSDIDVVLDTVSGTEFLTQFEKEADAHVSAAIIKANPDKSKHLETVRVVYNGFELDFAHLRSETYGDTRIPQIVPGTPKEDSYRRDFTINSLFYNVNDSAVEDFTGRGLKDIENKVLQTPLDSKKTFSDDPLRFIRGLRFAIQLGYSPDFEINIEEIAGPLLEKVSKERISIELEKMAKASLEKTSLMLHFTGLDKVLFGAETNSVERGASQALDKLEQKSLVDLIACMVVAGASIDECTKNITLPVKEMRYLNVLKMDDVVLRSAPYFFPETSAFVIHNTYEERAYKAVATIAHTKKPEEAAGIFADFKAISILLHKKKNFLLDGSDIQRLLNIPPSPRIKGALRYLRFMEIQNAGMTAKEAERLIVEGFVFNLF